MQSAQLGKIKNILLAASMFCRVVFEENVHYPVISDGDFAVIPVCFLLSCHLYSSASAGCVFTGGLPVAAIPLTAALALLCAA